MEYVKQGLPERRTLSPEECAAVLGVSRSLIYKLLRSGKLPSIRLGDRRLIPAAAIRRMLGEDAPIG